MPLNFPLDMRTFVCVPMCSSPLLDYSFERPEKRIPVVYCIILLLYIAMVQCCSVRPTYRDLPALKSLPRVHPTVSGTLHAPCPIPVALCRGCYDVRGRSH